eukprot:359985-Chlamydomonas_euryale.AAC.20
MEAYLHTRTCRERTELDFLATLANDLPRQCKGCVNQLQALSYVLNYWDPRTVIGTGVTLCAQFQVSVLLVESCISLQLKSSNTTLCVSKTSTFNLEGAPSAMHAAECGR